MRAWLLFAAGDDRQHGGNDGYDDQPDSYYSWDSTVPNHAALQAGDVVVLWDGRESDVELTVNNASSGGEG